MKQNNILFSVIVPVYNTELYLEDCIKSILNQTYKNFELLLVNDGSTDKSEQIITKYQELDPRIIYIKQKNMGQATARNNALKQAKGDYIIFIDSDDWVYNNYFESCVKILNNYQVDIICFPGNLSTNKRNMNDLIPPQDITIKVLNNFETMEEYARYKKINTVMWSKVYSRKIWKNIQFPNIKCREDAYIMHELLSKSTKTAYCNQDYYIYYIRKDSTERKSFTNDRFISIEIGKKCLELYTNKYPSLMYYCYCNIYLERKKNMLIEIINKKSFHQYKSSYQKIVKELQKEIKELKNNSEFKKYKKNININKIKFWAFHPYLSIIIYKCKNSIKRR